MSCKLGTETPGARTAVPNPLTAQFSVGEKIRLNFVYDTPLPAEAVGFVCGLITAFWDQIQSEIATIRLLYMEFAQTHVIYEMEILEDQTLPLQVEDLEPGTLLVELIQPFNPLLPLLIIGGLILLSGEN